MQEYKQYIITKGGQELGILISDIKEYLITPSQFKKLEKFMVGQTMTMVGDSPIIYVCDYLAFINNEPNRD